MMDALSQAKNHNFFYFSQLFFFPYEFFHVFRGEMLATLQSQILEVESSETNFKWDETIKGGFSDS